MTNNILNRNLGKSGERFLKIIDREHFYQLREEFVSRYGQSVKSIIPGEDGEYILLEPELMDEGENEDTEYRQVYLPKHLQGNSTL